MISIVLAQIWTRRGQAVALALLALFAVAAAVAAPAYLAAGDRAIAAGQIATAAPAERTVRLSATQDRQQAAGVDVARVGAALIGLPGFTTVYAEEFRAIGVDPDTHHASRVAYRQGLCTHLRIVTGRCLTGEGEVVVGVKTAAAHHLVAGQQVTIVYARLNEDPHDPVYTASGEPRQLTVAGTYTVPDPREDYWGLHGYFTALGDWDEGEPLFVGDTTLAGTDHGLSTVAIDGTAGPAALDPDNLDDLRAGLRQLGAATGDLGPALDISTDIEDLLDRIDSGQAAAHVLVPVLAVPLVLLACFTIFLAVGYGTQGRQPELAVVALRGNHLWVRWWLATGESLLPVLAGSAAGCIAGQVLVDVVAAARFPGVGTGAGWESLRYAPYACLAALLAAVLAQRRQLAGTVATLLRRHPAAPAGWRALAADLLVVLLAAVCTTQLTVSGSLDGIGTFAPAALILALALVAARALLPAVTRYAARALRAGRLGVALAGLQLSRRPGAQRLFALLAATVAVAVYAAGAVDVADRGRAVQARLGTGAARVLDVEAAYRSQLLAAVRAIDPDGGFAMAAERLRSTSTGEPLGLALDTTRLATVPAWPDGAPPPASVAARLRPGGEPAAPIVLDGTDITITATGSGFADGKGLTLGLSVSSLTGLGDRSATVGGVGEGTHDYHAYVAACAGGCRLNGLQLLAGAAVVGVTGRVVVTAIGTAGGPAVPAGQLADPALWRGHASTTLSAAPGGGLRIDLDAATGIPNGAWIKPARTPDPLPAAYAGAKATNDTVPGLDGSPQKLDYVAELPAVPVIGAHATLVDLEYADRLAVDGAQARSPQVWLNDRAPADIVDRLARHGLTVTGDTRATQVRRQLDSQGPALSLLFYLLAGVLAVLLGAGALVLAAAVDRTRRVEDLRALRDQGLRRRLADRATLLTYPVLVAIAAATGLVVGVLAWAATGWALPLAGLAKPALPMPLLPTPPLLAGTVAGVSALLGLVAWATGRDLLRRVDAKRRDQPAGATGRRTG